MTRDPNTSHVQGVQINGGTQNGPVTGGPGAQTVVHYGPSGLPPAQEGLLRAIAALRAELAERPRGVDDVTAQGAEIALDEAESEARRKQPRPGVLRLRVAGIATALGHVRELASGVSAVHGAFESFLSS
ncbi:hypothetical protein I5Q34_25225 [Streptomyces sp. AV19]|uniref:DUF5955 family protein n=1 Tax=Streptomyces sp. AV19 TaxID=2793068 RepID=UPI0018FE6719|nr:DUF5955 family protein [Streptomyces sp. AV19]MBH1937532.1 hypothetical protein [Streptomyces sp. AV19]MDG4533692.1 DUF5955 family protein [Streptomyces sp. AV19]